jgi:hypothetical protein
MRRKTAVQTKSDKQRLIDGVPVWESPFIMVHTKYAWRRRKISEIYAASRLKGGCDQDWPPHIL